MCPHDLHAVLRINYAKTTITSTPLGNSVDVIFILALLARAYIATPYFVCLSSMKYEVLRTETDRETESHTFLPRMSRNLEL
jgi:hypothetical protein